MNNQLLEFVRGNALFLGVLAVMAIGFLLLRTRGTRLSSMSEFDSLIAAGQPVLVEMYSNA
jgi:biotin transporter BioY